MEPYVSRLLAQYDPMPRGSRILVALSGGRDSVCLLHKLLSLQEEWDWTIMAAHLDHGIRAQSGRDADFVRELCARWQVPCILEKTDVPALRQEEALSLEDAARRARYAFLERTARSLSADRVALAHHALDQAETMLMHLARGSGLAGARGMQPRRGRYVRPMLFVPSGAVQQYFDAHQLSCVVDDTNFDRTNPRNALRHGAIPPMEAAYPALQEGFVRASLNFAEDEEALQALAEELMEDIRPEAGGVSARLKPSPHGALRRRALMRLAALAGLTRDLTREHIRRLDTLAASPRGRADLPHGFAAICDQGRIWIGRLQSCGACVPLETGAQILDWTLLRETLAEAPEDYRWAKPGRQCFQSLPREVVLRTRRPGDRLLGKSGSKKLSDHMNEKKIPLWLRDALPLAALGDRVLWLPYTGWADPHTFVQDPAQPVEILTIQEKRNEHEFGTGL